MTVRIRRLAALVATAPLGIAPISCSRGSPAPKAVAAAVTTTAPTTEPTSPVPFLSYERSGPSVTGVGETLTINSSGDFDLRLTGGGPRIGRFTGRLRPDQLMALRDATARLSGPYSSAGPIAPESVTERLTAWGVTATITGDDGLPAAWSEMLRIVRADAGQLTSSPLAALELVVDVSGAPRKIRGELHHLGTEPLALAGGPLVINVSVLGRSDVVRARWSITDTVDTTAAGAGWVRDLGLGRSDAIPSDDETVVVSVELSITDADGVVRRSRLTRSRA